MGAAGSKVAAVVGARVACVLAAPATAAAAAAGTGLGHTATKAPPLPIMPPPSPAPRFNLLREESEGYAKLATLLNQQAAGRLTPAAVPAVVRRLSHFAALPCCDTAACSGRACSHTCRAAARCRCPAPIAVPRCPSPSPSAAAG